MKACQQLQLISVPENTNQLQNEKDDYPGLIDVGLYGLHVVHGAFHTGAQKTEWGIDPTLKAMNNLFMKLQQKGRTIGT